MIQTSIFAQDKSNTTAVVRDLEELMCSAPELNWAAMVDGAFDYPTTEALPYAAAGVNCFSASAFEGLERAAPWLVPISATATGLALAARLVRHCSGRPMLSILATEGEVAAIAAGWKAVHWVMDDDGQRMLLRFADTRILATLPAVLAPQQWAAYTVPLAHWLMIDRQGKLAALPLASRIEAPLVKVKISQAQMGSLLRCSEPDAVIDMVLDTMSDIVPDELRGSALYTFVSGTCSLAHQYEVAAFPDLIALVVTAFLTNGDSNNDEQVIDLLKSKKWDVGNLSGALLAMPFFNESRETAAG